MIKVIGGMVLAMAVGGCAMSQGETRAAPPRGSAVALLKTPVGADAGRAVATQEGTSIRVVIEARGLPAGAHGVHVHTTGRCNAPDFASAGPHWNPGGTKHGTRNPAGPHAGDLPNLDVAADGTARLSMMLPSGMLDTMLDTDGAAFVVHAAADDLTTDPSGNSGGRIACGVFTVS